MVKFSALNEALTKVSAVRKDLGPEEKALLADMQSILNQLVQVETAEGPEAAQAPVESCVKMAALTDGQPAGDEEQKELEDKKLEKATASDNSAQRLDDLPVDDEKALQLVGKALQQLLGVGVAKSAPKIDPVVAALGTVAKSIESLAARQAVMEDSLVGILEGVGVADQLSASVKKSADARPIQSNGNDVASLVAALNAFVTKSAAPQAAEAPGTIKDVLTSLVG